MKFAKSFMLDKFAGNQAIVNRLNSIKGEYVEMDLMSPAQYKTYRQNKLFHALLSLFWDSGCSSYLNYDDMRLSYKRLAGLVKNVNGRIVESSWSDATKEQAKRCIDNLLTEMDVSGVIGSAVGQRYQNILNSLGEM